MIEMRPLKAEDMLWVVEHGVKELGVKACPNDYLRQIAKELEDEGTSITGIVDGVIVAVAGIDMLWEGVANIWLMVTPYIDEKPKETYRCIKDGMKLLFDKYNLRRVQSYGRVDFLECHNLFKHLGFKVEGMLKKYTHDGVDCIAYAIVR